MKETERDNSRFIKIDTSTSQKAGLIREWFKNDYLIRLTQIERYRYLGLETEDTRYALELEAYQKEQDLRALLGEPLLPDHKLIKII